MTVKDQYLAMLAKSKHIPLFFKKEWLDIFSDDWKVMLETEGDIQLFFVCPVEKNWGFTFIRNQPWTPYTGFMSNKPFEEISNAILKNLIDKMINKIPSHDYLYLDFCPDIKVLSDLPFYKTTIKHTNILLLADANLMFDKFKSSLQRQIRKGERNLYWDFGYDYQSFFQLYQLSLAQRGMANTMTLELLQKMITLCEAKKQGGIFMARDQHHQIHAGLLLVYDGETAYYLAGGSDKKFYGSGAMSYLMWQAIKHAQTIGKTYFDFEGSMTESIDKFFRSFATERVEYTHVESKKSKLLRIMQGMKTMVSRNRFKGD